MENILATKKVSGKEDFITWVIAILLMVVVFDAIPLFEYVSYTDEVWKLVTADGTRIYLQVPPANKHQKDYDYISSTSPYYKMWVKKVARVKTVSNSYIPPEQYTKF